MRSGPRFQFSKIRCWVRKWHDMMLMDPSLLLYETKCLRFLSFGAAKSSVWRPRIVWDPNLRIQWLCQVQNMQSTHIAALQCRASMLSSTSMNSRIHLVNVGMLAYILTSQHPFVLPLNQSSHFVRFLSCQVWYPYRYGLKYHLLFKSLNLPYLLFMITPFITIKQHTNKAK